MWDLFSRPLSYGVGARDPADFKYSAKFEQIECVRGGERYYRLSLYFCRRYSFDEGLDEVVWRLKVVGVVQDEIFVTVFEDVSEECREFSVVFGSKHFTRHKCFM